MALCEGFRLTKRDQPQSIPICPKCGYDQSGEIATWESSCPVEGICPECGLGFAWADVLDPSRVDLAWYVEHAMSKWEMVRRTIPTLWLLLIPNRYWSRMRMESSRSLRRYAIWIFAVMAVAHLLSTIALVVASHSNMKQMNASALQFLANQPPASRGQYQQLLYDVDGVDYWWPLIGESLLYPVVNRSLDTGGMTLDVGSFAIGCAGFSVMWFVLFCAFPTTRKRSQLRMVHVARAMVVAGLFPLLVIEIARVGDALLFAAIIRNPMLAFDSMAMTILFWMMICLLVWIQWFWVSAVWIGWKVKIRWYELILVVFASLFGILIGSFLVFVLSFIGQGIEMVASQIGI